MQTLASFIAVLAVLAAQAAVEPAALVRRYVDALGGEAALRAVRSRVTDGEFDNGRGLKTRFRTYDQTPNKRTTIIGTAAIESDSGSGRGYDGAAGWDKNFIGTGVRTLTGRELAALAREADLLRPLHLLDDCQAPRVEAGTGHDVLTCQTAGDRTRLHFDQQTGLLSQQEIEAEGRRTTLAFDDYRLVDDVRIPFRTRIVLPGATVSYVTTAVRHNQTIDDRIFSAPR